MHSDCLTEVLFPRTTKRKHICCGTFNSVCLIHCLTVVSYMYTGEVQWGTHFFQFLHHHPPSGGFWPASLSSQLKSCQGYLWYPFIADDWASSVLWSYNILCIFNFTVYIKRNEMFPFFPSRLYWVKKILKTLHQWKGKHLPHPQARNLKLLIMMWKS